MVHLRRSVRLVAFGVILIVVGATSPLYVMLLTSEDSAVVTGGAPLISEANDTGGEDKCLEGRFAIPVPDGTLYWQDAFLCGKDMRYWMGEGEPPGPIVNKPPQVFD